MSTIRLIVTHPGAAHRDDVLAVALALDEWGPVPVVRREPTGQELEDCGVVVLDCGMRLEPKLRNFDHHQLEASAECACAFTLLAQHLGLDALALQPWYAATAVLDAQGPVVLASKLGLPALPPELESPIEMALLEMFGQYSELPEWFIRLLADIGARLVASAREFAAALDDLRGAQVFYIDGVCGIRTEAVLTPVMGEAMARYRAEVQPELGLSIARSDRAGESWVLYRFEDHPRVDFSRLAGMDGVVFAHRVGFIAKLAEGVSLEAAVELAAKAIR